MKDHVIVVGGTKGLGKIITERFLTRGNKVSVLSRNAIDDPQQHLQHFRIDLFSLTDANEIAQEIVSQHGPIRYLIFCQRYRGEADHWMGEIQVSLKATDSLIKAFSEHFAEKGDKAIGIISSVYANFVGKSQPSSYHVAKAGLNQLVKYYAYKIGKKGIRVNSIMPLTYLKNESKDYYLSRSDLMKLYEKFVPLKRIGNAEDSANLIEFLCSDKSSFITGQHIYVDGGTSIVWPEELAKSLTGI
jgi:NAD(P)-dependent dehydrogenase (short-subunit alcohol dehydrogenase family)